MSHIQVDRPTCEGIGMCETQANEYFQIGDDGIVEVKQRHVRILDTDALRAIVNAPACAD